MSEDSKIAEAAAHNAVKETFLLFNVDIDDSDSRDRFQRDMMFIRDLRRGSDTARGYIWKTLISLIVGAAAIAVWKGMPWGGLDS